MSSVEVLVVGAGFGRGFLPLYLSHPLVSRVGLVDVDSAALASAAGECGISDTYASLEDALASGHWDAVHILSPVFLHVDQTLAVLASGRACASAVPMATSLDDIAQVIDAAGYKTYMMMETALYAREYLHAVELRDNGTLGRIGYLSGAHMQDLDGFPSYWMGYAPMHYATHIVAPLLGIAQAQAKAVSCLGSGHLLPHHLGDGSNPFPIESALFRLEGTDNLAAQVTLSFFENARGYTEGFNVYGEFAALEWPSVEGEEPIMHVAGAQDGTQRGRSSLRVVQHAPDFAERLPESLRQFTRHGMWGPGHGLPDIHVDASHGGSHPHLVHEFVSAVVEARPSAINELVAATITAPGIVAHQSALLGGTTLDIPRY